MSTQLILVEPDGSERVYTIPEGSKMRMVSDSHGDRTIEVSSTASEIRVPVERLGVVDTAPLPAEGLGGQDHPIVAWWLDDAREVAEATVPKAVEYGSVELVEAGRTLARLMGRGYVSDQEAAEVQIYQYVMGKMGRWTAAMSRDERVSDDTLLDILVYATMVRKIRQTGEWA